jgi:16S rRNA G1207 methylase RsmC
MSHYFSEDQEHKIEISEVKVELLGHLFSFDTANEVFSRGELDKGSFVLIKGAKVKDKERVLDLGCGYGAVGIALAKEYDIKLTMTDINKRAVKLAKNNAKRNGVSADVFQGDMFSSLPSGAEFDVVLLNPPQHAGKDVCIEMIKGSKKLLALGGTLQMVARHKKGGKSLSEEMQEVFGNVESIYIKSGFRVYMSIKN